MVTPQKNTQETHLFEDRKEASVYHNLLVLLKKVTSKENVEF